MKARQATTTFTILDNAEDAKEYLRAVGVKGPSLHPRVVAPETRNRWNGWNHAKTIGIDNEGNFVGIESWHFASGHTDFSGQWNGSGGRMGSIAFDDFVWPIQVFPALPIIRHPEYTPTDDAPPPPCPNHREVQHRDRKPPWCNACGWRHAKPGTPAKKETP